MSEPTKSAAQLLQLRRAAGLTAADIPKDYSMVEKSNREELLAAADRLDARSDLRRREMFASDLKADAAASARDYDLAAVLYDEALGLLSESVDLHASAVALRRRAAAL